MRRLLTVWLLIGLLAIAFTAPVLADDEDTPAGLVVDASQSLGEISPYVLGSNYTPWTSIPFDLIPAAQALGINYLRLGGGFSDERDLYPDFIDMFIVVARMIDAEPAITVRLLHSTPEQSAESVRYTNIERGYGVRYWSIGNEPSLFQTMFRTDYTTEDYNREWRAHAEAMKAVDPDIVLIGPDVHQYPGVPGMNPQDVEGRDWVEEFLKANGDLVDIVAVHRYPFPRSQANPVITIDDLRGNTREWDANIIPGLRAVIRETTGRDLPVAVTEVNSSWANNIGGEATLDSHYNAIWYADVLGRLIREQVSIAVYFDLQRRNENFGIIGGSGVRPVYYTFMIYQQFGSELLAASSDDADVSVFAALRDDGALTLIFVNLGLEPATLPLTISGYDGVDEADVWLFDPVAVTDEITLAGQSVTLRVIPPAE